MSDKGALHQLPDWISITLLGATIVPASVSLTKVAEYGTGAIPISAYLGAFYVILWRVKMAADDIFLFREIEENQLLMSTPKHRAIEWLLCLLSWSLWLCVAPVSSLPLSFQYTILFPIALFLGVAWIIFSWVFREEAARTRFGKWQRGVWITHNIVTGLVLLVFIRPCGSLAEVPGWPVFVISGIFLLDLGTSCFNWSGVRVWRAS